MQPQHPLSDTDRLLAQQNDLLRSLNYQLEHVSRDVNAIQSKPGPHRVQVVDLDMHFGTMVWFMVKLVIAAIPALLILGLFGFVGTVLFYGLVAAMIGF